MNKNPSSELRNPAYRRRKSKIQNRKWAGLVVLALMIWGDLASAQQRKSPRLGFLVPGTEAAFTTRVNAFRQGMREFGYVERKNITIEYRYAERGVAELPQLAAELVQLPVDIIMTAGTGIAAAQKATRTIPIVFAAATNPVGSGVVDSLARPGGNATGLTNLSEDLDGKRLELLRDTVKACSHSPPVAHG